VDESRKAGVRGCKLFDRETIFHEGSAGSAIGFGNQHAEEAELGRGFQFLTRPRCGLIALCRRRRNYFGRYFSSRVADQELLIAQECC
jgi:hypothetical protein